MSSYKILKEDGDYLLLETGEFLLQDPPILVDVSDSVTTLETVFLNNAFNIDDLFITENVTVSMNAGDISVADPVQAQDDMNILHDIWYIEINDQVTLGDYFTYDWPIAILPFESVAISENIDTQSIRYSSDNRKPRWPNGGVSGSISLIE